MNMYTNPLGTCVCGNEKPDYLIMCYECRINESTKDIEPVEKMDDKRNNAKKVNELLRKIVCDYSERTGIAGFSALTEDCGEFFEKMKKDFGLPDDTISMLTIQSQLSMALTILFSVDKSIKRRLTSEEYELHRKKLTCTINKLLEFGDLGPRHEIDIRDPEDIKITGE